MKRESFLLPAEIYLDGNSLGPLPRAAQSAVERKLLQWQSFAVSGWSEWFELAESFSPTLARLIGARPQEVCATGGLTINLHALMATFYRPTGSRRDLLATELDFPSDLYALQAWAERAGADLKLIASRDGYTLHPDDIESCLTEDVAIALLPTVLYRSGQLLDVAAITARAKEAGIIAGWDAAHSIGCIPHDFHEAGVDFAVWCSYKYLNAGPGAPGGLFVHERHHRIRPGMPGWWGHDKLSQFELRTDFTPAAGACRFQIGTPSILALAGLEGALEVFDEVDIRELRQRSLELTDHLILRTDKTLPEFSVVTPRSHRDRGGHVALRQVEARRISLALRRRGIVADHRPPDLLRLAPVALYNTEAELDAAVDALRELLDTESYLDEAADSPIT